jgi:hypothetical protein
VHGGTVDASRRILTGLRPASAVRSFVAHAIAGRYGDGSRARRKGSGDAPPAGMRRRHSANLRLRSLGASIRRDAIKTRGSGRALVPCAVLLSPCCLQLKSL